MGRKAKELETLHPDAPLDADALEAARAQQAKRMDVALAHFGDGLPYDQERYINEARFYMAQSAEALLQAGRRLLVLKEAVPHGEFIEIVETRLGIAERAAQKMMQAAVKFSSPSGLPAHKAAALVEAAGGRTKLIELMALDNEELEAITDEGGLLELDDIRRMSALELRAALREARDNYEAQAALLADKNAKIDKLQGDLRKAKRRVQETPADQVAAELAQEVGRYAFAAEAAVRGDLRRGCEALADHAYDQSGAEYTALMHGFLLQVERALNEIRADLNIPHTLSADVLPELATMDLGG